ncbi:ATPase WRNIP1 (Werner helicase-interacting protein 1) [Durusdinium trenchii]|uniref:ATPase WRNIP1 (Werner helicase-interacting protein 1) n=1 Tax=Durusdinium trenchii TaxID=1381693 RepID=A0ABP0P0Q7_9DINO
MILWGPPGCGKTSFAHCLAAQSATSTRSTPAGSCPSGTSGTTCFRQLSAARVGLAELREELKAAQQKAKKGVKTILFVDELHRWSKAQQDALLQDSERGTITLIGATTENPSFSLNNAILSRCRLVVFAKLSSEAIGRVIDRAVALDQQLAGVHLSAEARQLLVAAADGDARVALNSLELAASLGATAPAPTGGATGPAIEAETVRAAVQRRALYDRNGDFHYDLISALHKSLRGGSADAALYYAVRMLTAGEEPRYVTRRLIRFASEDVGLADPLALSQAVAADQAVHAIGMPEAGVVIAQCVIYLALAPKSCAVYRAYEAAQKVCEEEPHAAVANRLSLPPFRWAQSGSPSGVEFEAGRLSISVGLWSRNQVGDGVGVKSFGGKRRRTKKMGFELIRVKLWEIFFLEDLCKVPTLGAVAGVFIGRAAVEARQVLSPFVVSSMATLLQEAQLHRCLILPGPTVNVGALAAQGPSQIPQEAPAWLRFWSYEAEDRAFRGSGIQLLDLENGLALVPASMALRVNGSLATATLVELHGLPEEVLGKESMTGMLAMCCGGFFEVFKDVFSTARETKPYIKEQYKGRQIECVRYRPFEDVCCVGRSDGFGSLVVPGAGKANFDSFEANPFETKSQRREREVQSLLEKLQPDSIMLNPDDIGQIDREVVKVWRDNSKKEEEAKAKEEAAKKKPVKKMRGKNKVGNRMKRKALKQGAEGRQKARNRLAGEKDEDDDDDDDGEEEDDEGEEVEEQAGSKKKKDPQVPAGVGTALSRFYGKRRRKT